MGPNHSRAPAAALSRRLSGAAAFWAVSILIRHKLAQPVETAQQVLRQAETAPDAGARRRVPS